MTRNDLKNMYFCCELCPRRCRADRHSQKGFCGCGPSIRAAKAMLHPWEEPALTEEGKPSGAVFFSGCTLGCVFCQNWQISREGFGKELTAEELASVFLSLQEKGASNIDLVTPTQYLPDILGALELCKSDLRLPVVYNCGGYERREIVELMENDVDIWLPDLKYFSSETAARYSAAPDYFNTALGALEEMLRQVKASECRTDRESAGKRELRGNTDPAAQKGGKKLLVVRHMVLPGQKEDSVRLLRALADRLGTEGYLLSLMSQYTPFYKAKDHPEINRRVTSYEYGKVLEEAVRLGFSGYMQERTSAKEEYTPVFDLSGL